MSSKRIIDTDEHFIPESNVDSTHFLFELSKICPTFAFIVPTETGLKKSIMDATGMVRFFLKFSGLHDYNEQQQGPENKVVIKSFLVHKDSIEETNASLYRPLTKKGDPRIWISKLPKYALNRDLVMLFALNKNIYVVNLSKPDIVASLEAHGFVYNTINKSKIEATKAKEELLELLKHLNEKGWIKSTTNGDTSVGDTLEHELGIKRNNSTSPDYKGIELKASRLNRNGQRKQKTRITLFAKTPDEGLTYREIMENYGKYQIPKGQTTPRLQLYETFKCSRINAYDLYLKTDPQNETLDLMHSSSKDINDKNNNFVSAWKLESLVHSLQEKHKETFFVKAESKLIDGVEYFKYKKVIYTSNPNTSVLFALFDEDKITLDLAIHLKENGVARDHGALFKMFPDDLPLLFGDEEIIDLEK